MMPFCFANDEIIPSSDARIHPMDLAFIRGYGIFDFFRVSNYKPLFLEQYLDRFTNSARETYLNLSYSKDELRKIIFELIEKNQMQSGGFRMLLSGGVSENSFSPAKGALFIFSEPLIFPAQEKYEKGVKLISLDHIRPVAHIKMTNYAYPVWHSKKWQEAGAMDVLYHRNGIISESSRSNFFLIKDGVLITPDRDILNGITRHQVLGLTDHQEIRTVSMEDVKEADEAFITSTTKVILPVTQIDDLKIGNGTVGLKTIELLEKFRLMENTLIS